MPEAKYSAEELDDFAGKAQNGDTEAFSKIYDNFIDQIYRYVFFRVNRDEALDLTETVFLKVWENIGSYGVGKNYLSSWIYRIAHNLIVDHYRLSKEIAPLEITVPDEKADNNPVAMTERQLSRSYLSKAISKLKKKYQQVIVLKYINELDNREIAQIMKKTEGSLRILKFRALKELRRVMEEMGVRY